MNRWKQPVSPKVQLGVLSLLSLMTGALAVYAFMEVNNLTFGETQPVVSTTQQESTQEEQPEFLDAEEAEGEEIMMDPNNNATITPFSVSAQCLSTVDTLHTERDLSTKESKLEGTNLSLTHPEAYSFQKASTPTNGAQTFFEVSQTSAAPSSPRIVGIELYSEESINADTKNEDLQGPFQGMTPEQYQVVKKAFSDEIPPQEGVVQQSQCRPWIVQTVQGAGETFWLRFYDTVIKDQVVRVILIQDNTQYNGFLKSSVQNEASDELFELFSIRSL